ncbi:hypothetical protein JMA_04260 [Jeotgalibacillus malaysiensis]|uniref:Lipoprotein n=1 Tax=Jeotgalibacillus malaysiensis TaxID=1508404 RepID=A0A0B5AMG5_9BACL|nr:hypothetical protein [Jeotgalibacillus malaysiensis]AJD89743.1 hypothetical protein JMA_04260 [Jeotgalibacillus malaysiensis]
MKKIMLTLFTVLLLTGCGCTDGMREGNNITIHIKNNSDLTLYGMEIHLPNSSHTVLNANGTEISRGEDLVIQLLKDEMTGAENKSFEVFALADQSGRNRILVENPYRIDFRSAQSWYFELNGEGAKSLALKKEK